MSETNGEVSVGEIVSLQWGGYECRWLPMQRVTALLSRREYRAYSIQGFVRLRVIDQLAVLIQVLMENNGTRMQERRRNVYANQHSTFLVNRAPGEQASELHTRRTRYKFRDNRVVCVLKVRELLVEYSQHVTMQAHERCVVGSRNILRKLRLELGVEADIILLGSDDELGVNLLSSVCACAFAWYW